MADPTNAWDEIFKRQGRVFTEPHADVPGIVQLLKRRGADTVLDLGSGSGRHTVYLARHGFSVYGLDNSAAGIEITRQWLAEGGLAAELQLQNMTQKLPYPDAFFDAVISIQVIHHARLATIRGIVREIARILKRGGFVFVTVPALRNQAGSFEEVEPRTFVPLDGHEKGLPHHIFTPEELRQLFGAFDVTDVHLDAFEHHCLSAFKR